MKIWLHRIVHEAEAARLLLNRGILSTGRSGNAFANIGQGDQVLVPLFNHFSVYEVLSSAMPVAELRLPYLHTWGNEQIILRNGLLTTETRDEAYDIGFAIYVKPVECAIPIKYADSALSDLIIKMRSINADITEYRGCIKETIELFRNSYSATVVLV